MQFAQVMRNTKRANLKCNLGLNMTEKEQYCLSNKQS